MEVAAAAAGDPPVDPKFVGDDVNNILKECMDESLGPVQFAHHRIGQWTSTVCEKCIARLTALNKPFKYIVTCIIMQKHGAGMVTASSCFWDSMSDGSRTMRWENKTMYAIATAYALAI